MPLRTRFLALSFACVLSVPAHAQFLDPFDAKTLDGWFTMTGDGTPTVTFTAQEGYARLAVDGSTDRHNVYWALIKRDVAPHLDLTLLQDPAYELRVEARVRPSHAPRRVNVMINTQRTTDFHQHLREFDLPATGEWRTISFTTQDFDVRPGDQVFVQFAMTDWGLGQYHVDLDYYRADVVLRDTARADLGEPLVYHPPLTRPEAFPHHLPAAHDTVIHADFPDVSFNRWQAVDSSGAVPVLTVSARQYALLRWEFGALGDALSDGPAVLELTTQAVAKGGDYVSAFGEDLGVEFNKLRVFELVGGPANWNQADATFHSVVGEGGLDSVANSQMTFDVEVGAAPGDKTYVTLPRPVAQRLLSGQTKGLLLQPLGAIHVSLFASEDAKGRGPILHLKTKAAP